MSKIVYLSNGQCAYLQEKIGDKFIVKKIMEVESYEGETIEIESDAIVVDSVFDNPPVDKIDKEISKAEEKKKSLLSLIEEKKTELYQLEGKLRTTQSTLITNEKFIINKSEFINADSIAFFTSGQIMPKVLKKDSFKYGGFHGLKISMQIEFSGKESSWGYTIYHDDERFSSGDYLCPKYGVVINPTQERLDEIIREKLSKIDLKDGYVYQTLSRVPAEYYTPEIIELMAIRKKREVENELEKSKREFKALELKIQDQTSMLQSFDNI